MESGGVFSGFNNREWLLDTGHHERELKLNFGSVPCLQIPRLTGPFLCWIGLRE